MKVKENDGTHSFFGSLSEELERGKAGGKTGIFINIAAITLGFVFSGYHLVFGAYPVGLSLVCALPSSVYFALLGTVLGYIMLGKAGGVYAVACILAVLLRMLISEKEKRFQEGYLLRVCFAVIGSFIVSAYNVIVEGLKLETLVFCAVMIIFSSGITLILCGAFYEKISVGEVIFGGKRIFLAAKDESMRLSLFRISFLALLLLISLSLKKYRMFGLDFSYVFSVVITVFVSKRFGALYGSVVGFVSTVGISGLYSVAFALLGAFSGALFSFGSMFAMTSGAVALSLWGAYVGGVTGFLSVFPELLVGFCLIIPAVKYLEREDVPSEVETVKRRATDMVGTMALSKRGRALLVIENMELSFSSALPLISEFCENEALLESYAVFSRLMSEVKSSSAEDGVLDDVLTESLEREFSAFGFGGGVIRAFGGRRKSVICAAEDKSGVKITLPAFIRALEEACGCRLSRPDYYRRDDMVLMECEADAKYELIGAFAEAANSGGETSGDTVRLINSKELFAYGLICDGMGSGNEAKRTSKFLSDFLACTLDMRVSLSSLVHVLNSIVRHKKEECGVALDLFSFDLINGDALFLKSGAAPSYIKRPSSLFRIKSETMPLGFIKQVDAEKISVSLSPEDYVIMLSDGISQAGEDASWLVEFLNRPPICDLKEYAEAILNEARANGKGSDDMSVLVMRISEI